MHLAHGTEVGGNTIPRLLDRLRRLFFFKKMHFVEQIKNLRAWGAEPPRKQSRRVQRASEALKTIKTGTHIVRSSLYRIKAMCLEHVINQQNKQNK